MKNEPSIAVPIQTGLQSTVVHVNHAASVRHKLLSHFAHLRDSTPIKRITLPTQNA